MEIIDCHTHLVLPGDRRDNQPWKTFEEIIAIQRAAGITGAIGGGYYMQGYYSPETITYENLVAHNRRIAAVYDASEGFYIPGAEIRPVLGEQACDLARFCHDELGMCFTGEMFDHWHGYVWGTPEYYRLIECIIDLRMVPLIHCDNPVVHDIGTRYPEGRFMIAHMGDCKGENKIDAVTNYPNLVLEISGSEIMIAGRIKQAVETLGVERVVFGSDVAACDPVLSVLCVNRSGLSETEQAQVFAGSFRKLQKWTEKGTDTFSGR
jgi:predicted TIM-barrel fold metal-dependent hydrolase